MSFSAICFTPCAARRLYGTAGNGVSLPSASPPPPPLRTTLNLNVERNSVMKFELYASRMEYGPHCCHQRTERHCNAFRLLVDSTGYTGLTELRAFARSLLDFLPFPFTLFLRLWI